MSLQSFFGSHGIVPHKFAPESQTISEQYLYILPDGFKLALCSCEKKAARYVENKKVSAPPCSRLFCPCHPRFSCKKNGTFFLFNRLGFPDLTSCDFWFFQKLKTTL